MKKYQFYKSIFLKFNFIFGILFLMHQTGMGQYNKKWVVYNKQIDVSLATPNVTALPTTPSITKNPSNGVYNTSGILLFYVSDCKIYNGAGAVISNFYGSISSHSIPICRVPGTTDQYYVIYNIPCPMCYWPLYYTKIRVTGTTATVVTGQDNVQFSLSHTYFDYVRMVVSLDNENTPKYLYACGTSGIIDQYAIGNSGISFVQNLTNSACCSGSEMDITWDGRKMAIPNSSGINVYTLDACGNGGILSSQVYTVPGTSCGVEFNDAGDHLFATSGSGIYDINLNAAPTSYATVSTSSLFGASFIERGYNGKMFVANSSGLSYFNQTASYTFKLNAVAFNNPLVSTKYPLPTQNDFLNGIAGANAAIGTCCNANIGRTVVAGCNCTYSWMPVTGLNSPTNSQTLAHPSTTTTYTLTRTCGSNITSDFVTVTVSGKSCCRLAGNDNEPAMEINIFPNPSAGQFLVEAPEGTTIRKIILLDMNGRCVLNLANTYPGNTLQADADKLANGIYLMEIVGENESWKKLVTINK